MRFNLEITDDQLKLSYSSYNIAKPFRFEEEVKALSLNQEELVLNFDFLFQENLGALKKEFLESLSFFRLMQYKFWGCKMFVRSGLDCFQDQIILRTFFGYLDVAYNARSILFFVKGKKIQNEPKLFMSIEYLQNKYKKSKEDCFRVRSDIYDVDSFFDL